MHLCASSTYILHDTIIYSICDIQLNTSKCIHMNKYTVVYSIKNTYAQLYNNICRNNKVQHVNILYQ